MKKEIRVLYPDIINNTGTAIFRDDKFNNVSHIEYVLPINYVDYLHKSQSKGQFLSDAAMEFLDFLSKQHIQGKDVTKGVKIEKDLTFKLMHVNYKDKEEVPFSTIKDIDECILKLLGELTEKNQDAELYVISQKKATRASYRLRGYKSLDFNFDPWDPGMVNEGVLFIEQFSQEKLKRIFMKNSFGIETVPSLEEILDIKLKPNQFLKIFGSGDEKFKYFQVTLNQEKQKHLAPVPAKSYINKSIQGISPRTDEQALLFHLMENCDVIGVHGIVGSGKTILALAYLTELVKQEKLDRLIITKPIVSIGQPIGFTKGDKIMKLRQWFGNFLDNISKLDIYGEYGARIPNLIYDPWGEVDFLKDATVKGRIPKEGMFELESLEYVRGRNFERVGVMIDESQNLKPDELKALIGRMDKGSKFVIIGDIDQVDRTIPGFNRKYNGYLAFVKAYWGEPYVGMLDFTETQRHPAAEQSTKIPFKHIDRL